MKKLLHGNLKYFHIPSHLWGMQYEPHGFLSVHQFRSSLCIAAAYGTVPMFELFVNSVSGCMSDSEAAYRCGPTSMQNLSKFSNIINIS